MTFPTHQTSTPAHQPTRRRWPIIVGVLAAVAAVAAGTLLAVTVLRDDRDKPSPTVTSAPSTAQVMGRLTLALPGFQWQASDQSCTGIGGYGDVRKGAQVVVTDPAGKVVATGELGTGTATVEGRRATACVFSFYVQVPGGLARYGIEVSRRGVVWFNPDQLTTAQLTLG